MDEQLPCEGEGVRNSDQPALVGTATRGQLVGYRVEIWPGEPSGWYVLYFPPGADSFQYNSYGEDWDAALGYGELYGVAWESGYAL